MLAVVAALAFLLLLLAFRSFAVSLISVGLNLLSVGAAYGVITLIFQDGHLERQLGFTSYGGIVSWVPLFLFVFLFGLSMDYHVFILSRIRELRGRGASTPDAVVGGIASSAGVVTSAAVIMVAVFSILASLSLISLTASREAQLRPRCPGRGSSPPRPGHRFPYRAESARPSRPRTRRG